MRSLTPEETPSLSDIQPLVLSHQKNASTHKQQKRTRKRQNTKQKRQRCQSGELCNTEALKVSTDVSTFSTNVCHKCNNTRQSDRCKCYEFTEDDTPGTTLFEAASILDRQGIELSLLTDPDHIILDQSSWDLSLGKWQFICSQLNELNCTAINSCGHCCSDISSQFHQAKNFSFTNLDLHSLLPDQMPTHPVMELWLRW